MHFVVKVNLICIIIHTSKEILYVCRGLALGCCTFAK